MKNTLFLILIIFISLSFNSCITVDTGFKGLPPGKWRAVLKLDNRPKIVNKKAEPLPELMGLEFEEVTDGELPFNFEIIHDTETEFHIEIINGEERIRIDDVTIGLDRSTAKDTVVIKFPLYESYIKAIFEERIMEGVWIVPSRGNYQIPFIAKHGEGHRFSTIRKEPVMDISGKWEVTFLDGDSYKGIGEFKQKGNILTGTFMTETGDYRFLEGEIQENKIYLSAFDGAHAFLYEAKINATDSTMIGSFRSGKHYKTVWEAKKNENATLTNPNDLTFLKEGYDKIEFKFPNTEGKMVSLDDEKYQGKAKIIQIFGTWCPNCRDETNFLKEYLNNNKHPDLEVIALAFEKHRALEKATASVKRYEDKFNLPYEILIAGYSNKKEAAQSLPMLNHILSYPTMIFIDKNDQVTKIHTGFNGPATSEFESFKKEFKANVQEVLGN
jgi:thiol-disulfide isomerase/thioredoxin